MAMIAVDGKVPTTAVVMVGSLALPSVGCEAVPRAVRTVM